MASPSATAGSRPSPATPRKVGRTELSAYPSGGTRFLCLGIVVLATIVLYYQFYLAGSVAAGTNGKNGILVDYHMSFKYYVYIAVVGYILGAAASFVSGIADKVGRVNIITAGLVIVALLCLVGIPLADSKVGFAIVFGAIGLVEGVILVATPALIRDFSPQLGRASAMGFWTLGPVLGSLVVSIQLSSTSTSTPWHHQYIASGIVGLVVAALSFLFLRELTPELRDQLMVSANDRALIEARAQGLDVKEIAAATKSPFKQMLKLDIVGSAFAISVFLIIYYIAVGFFPVYFQTIFSYSQPKANALGNYVWAFDAAALIIVGIISDKVRVRKPFMLVGAIGAIVMTAIFATRATHPGTSYTSFIVILSLLAVFLGIAYAPWMASFTETVEKRNPALTATGLAVWGLVIRIVIAVSVFFVPTVVSTVSTLVNDGAPIVAAAAAADTAGEANNPSAPKIVEALQANPEIGPQTQAYATKYGAQLAIAAKIDSKTAAALGANPNDQAAQVQALADISGKPAADVATVATLEAQYPKQITTLGYLDSATATALVLNPNDAAAQQKAVGEIATKGNVPQAAAVQQLTAAGAFVKTVGVAKLQTLQSTGPAVATAVTQLKMVSTIPAKVTTFFSKTGPAALGANNFAALTNLSNTKLQSALATLNSPIGKKVAKAKSDSPKQWRNYYWIAVGGEVVFIPLIFLLTGFWSPKKARKAEEEHEAAVEREMAELKG